MFSFGFVLEDDVFYDWNDPSAAGVFQLREELGKGIEFAAFGALASGSVGSSVREKSGQGGPAAMISSACRSGSC